MDLTTYANYKIFKPSKSTGQNATEDYVARVKMVITSVSAKIGTFLDRNVEVGEAVEVHTIPKGSGMRQVMLESIPVDSITSIELEGTALDVDDYRFTSSRGLLSFTPNITRDSVQYPEQALVITYVGGMATNTEDFISKYPDIVAEVHAQIRFELTRITNIAEKSFSKDNETTTLEKFDLLPSVKRILAKYTRLKGFH